MSLDVRRRILELDGLRGLAIGSVLLYHYGVLEGARSAFQLLPAFLFPISRVGNFGWMGVDLFFALSGFLIGGILIDSAGRDGYFRVFYIRRAYRILPIYLVLCAFAAGLWRSGLTQGSPTHEWLFQGLVPWYAYLTFGQNLWMAHLGAIGSKIIDATWSLAIEEQFYLVLPLLLWMVGPRAVPVVASVGIILAPFARLATFAVMPEAWRGQAVYVLTWCRMDVLLMGVLIAWAWRQPTIRRWFQERALIVALASSALTIAVASMAVAGWGFQTAALMTWGLSVVAAWCGSMVLLALCHPSGQWARLLRWSWLGALGGVSYCIYLFHQPVLGLTHWLLRDALPGLSNFPARLTTAIALLTTLVLARLSWRYLEGPLIRRGHTHRYETREPATTREAEWSNASA